MATDGIEENFSKVRETQSRRAVVADDGLGLRETGFPRAEQMVENRLRAAKASAKTELAMRPVTLPH